MPDHVHLLVEAARPDSDLRRFARSLHHRQSSAGWPGHFATWIPVQWLRRLDIARTRRWLHVV